MQKDVSQPGSDLSERDIDLIQKIEAEGLTDFTFDGVRRLTGAHPETLSRSIERLEDSGMISRTPDGYAVEEAARGVASRGLMADEQRVPLLNTLLPFEIEPGALVAALRGRWFGSLRWVGVSQAMDGLTLKWVSDDGRLFIDARFSRGHLAVEARMRDGASLSAGVRAAHQLMSRVSRLYEGRRRPTASYFVADDASRPAAM